jgi:hypothetical protein
MGLGRVRVALLLAAAWVGAGGCGSGGGGGGPPTINVTGTWVGTLVVGGTTRTFAFQLHQRSDGGVLGYVLGGTSRRVVAGGAVAGSALTLGIELADPGLTRAFLVTGTVAGDVYTASADDGTGVQPVSWTRTAAVLHERRFLLAAAAGGEPGSLVEVSVVQDALGALVCGGFVGLDDCTLLACGGGVSSFSDVGGVLSIGVETSGGCAAGAGITATFDPGERLYLGTATSCGGIVVPALAGRGGRARSDHVASMLASLAALAGDLEALAAFTAPYAPVSPGYLHDGATRADLLASLQAEVAAHASIDVTFSRFRNANTVDDPDTFPMLDAPFGIRFHDRRVGPPAGGGASVVYRDSDMATLLDAELRFFREEGGAWVLRGNQSGPMDLPFAYTLGAEALDVPTPGGTVHVSVGTWGAHFGPWTGHAAGNAKSDMVGFLTASDADLDELAGGDGDGDCEPGETCGFPGGPKGDGIRDRTPLYVAPLPGVVDSIEYVRDPTGVYFDDPPQWRVRVALSNGLRLDLDHVARMAPALRAAVQAATGIDTDLFAGPEGTDVLGGATIPVAQGDALCYPQVFATAVPGFPGWYGGGGAFDRPWAQMEFFVTAPVDGVLSEDVCVFAHLPAPLRASLQAMVDADIANPLAQRFRQVGSTRWEWAAEGLLCPSYSVGPGRFEGLHERLGGWFERAAPGTTPDELFAIVPIAKSAASYDPSLYSSPAVDHLVTRRRVGGAFSWTVPGLGVVMPFYPSGEVLEDTASTLLIRWRLEGVASDVFQRAAYLLDGSGLKVRWGPYATTIAGAAAPVLLPGDPCDDADVLCYAHTRIDGL